MTMSLLLEGQNLKIEGALDRFTLGAASCYKFPSANGAITIDLTDVKNTDTAGLAWLLKLVSHYQQSQSVTIINEPQQLIALADISNVLELLPIKH